MIQIITINSLSRYDNFNERRLKTYADSRISAKTWLVVFKSKLFKGGKSK
jgi:hypothetical protein